MRLFGQLPNNGRKRERNTVLKKIIILLISVFMPVSAVYAAEGSIHAAARNISVSGKIQGNCSAVTLTLKNKQTGTTEYISELDINDSGEYFTKFKFNGDYENCILYVNEGDKDIRSSVLNVCSDSIMCIGDITAEAFNNGNVTSEINLINKYDDEGECQVIFSFYDINGKLLGIDTEKQSYDYYSGKGVYTKAVPENTYMAKVFLWQSFTDAIPIAKPDTVLPEKDIILIGDSLGQGYSAQSCRKGWGEYIGNYMAKGANVINECHAGWDTLMYVENTAEGWEHAKSFIDKDDIVIFGLGYNDYCTMGYGGKYYDTIDGQRKIYYYSGSGINSSSDMLYETQTDKNGKTYVDTASFGKLFANSGVSLEVSKDGAFTYLYKDENDIVNSYAADCFYDNMKIMLDDCKDIGAEVVIRNVAAICSKNAQSRESGYYGYVTQSIINEKCIDLAAEYDNVTVVDLYSETKEHFSDIYNGANGIPSYFYDEDGAILPYIRQDYRLQQLADKYWLTIKNYAEFYKDGYIGQNPADESQWGYIKADKSFVAEDTLHYNSAGADYIASAIAELIKKSDSPAKEYFK